MQTTQRVGLVGAGPATQAIHLPTLKMFGDQIQVTHIVDPNVTLAEAVAAPLDAHASGSLDDMLADGVDIAVVASPNAFHAAQIQALCAAGVKGIMAEKPLATTGDEAQAVAGAVRAAGTALVVGAMHLYDPAWIAAHESMAEHVTAPIRVRCATYLPPNSYYEDQATKMIRPPAPPEPAEPPSAADVLRGGVLGLAIHDLPLIRRFIPSLDNVSKAETATPWGYAITAEGQAGSVELLARMGDTWQADWTLQISSEDGANLTMQMPPSYVHVGSATATVSGVPGSPATTFGPYKTDGYIAEWQELLAIMDGATPRYSLDDMMADFMYALALADLAVAANDGEQS
ncbi:MAG: Gfo/Idh/MocA family oxidoreductase [Propionibacteriaceae bacterium]|nr:Gfo/Idh/MocA family oxidoreductase [Propionibacteriaceae bacterium]